MGDSSEHAKLSPSGADRWATCTASSACEAKYPDQPSSSFAQEGTDAHDLLERAVKAATRPSTLEPNHPACRAVDQCFDLVLPYMEDPNFIVMSEVKVKLCEDVYGTADIVIMGSGLLLVYDYKHGQGVVVEQPCLQLEIYAAAALKSLACMAPEPITEIETGIIQPRASHPTGPVRLKRYGVSEIREKGEMIETLAKAINEGKTKFRPSEKACKWCRASGDCSHQAELALDKAKSHFTTIDDGSRVVETQASWGAAVLSVEDKVAIFEATKFITDFLKAVGVSIQSGLLAGEQIPGLKVVAGKSNRTWGEKDDEGNITKLDDAAVLEKLTKDCKLKKTQITTEKLLGIPAIEKMIDTNKRGGAKKLEALRNIIVKPEGKPVVVSEDDARPSIAPHFTTVTDPLA